MFLQVEKGAQFLSAPTTYAKELKEIYHSQDESTGKKVLEVKEKWYKQYPTSTDSQVNVWASIAPIFNYLAKSDNYLSYESN